MDAPVLESESPELMIVEWVLTEAPVEPHSLANSMEPWLILTEAPVEASISALCADSDAMLTELPVVASISSLLHCREAMDSLLPVDALPSNSSAIIVPVTVMLDATEASAESRELVCTVISILFITVR